MAAWVGSMRAGALLSLTASCGLQAQTSDSVGTPAEIQQTCTKAVRDVSSHQPDSVYRVSLRTLPSCRDQAGVALAGAWREPPASQASLKALSEVSGQVRDERILEAVISVASDQAQPVDRRLAAMAVLVNYFDPHLYAEFPEPPTTPVHPGQYVRIGESNNDLSQPGSRPLTSTVRSRVVRLFQQLGETDSNERVRNAAKFLGSQLGKRL